MMTKNTIDKENPAATHNNLVAESEIRAALEAIENRLESFKANGWKKRQDEDDRDEDAKIADDEKNESDDSLDAETKATLDNLLDKAKQSLPDHIRRVVQSVSDVEFHKYARRNEIPSAEDEQSESDDEEFSESEGEISEEEYDEEELIDQNAVQRARVLRKQVREAASRVQILRDSATSRAIAIAEREVQLMQDSSGVDNIQSFDAAEFESKLRAPIKDISMDKTARMVEMEKALSKLMSSLKEVDTKLPESMETLQETIETIQESLSKQNPQGMSQTERAIVSRDNEGNEEVLSTPDDQSNIPPNKRLASFLSNY